MFGGSENGNFFQNVVKCNCKGQSTGQQTAGRMRWRLKRRQDPAAGGLRAGTVLKSIHGRGERMQDGFVVLVKKRMIEKGRDDFVSYLAEILGITKQGASKKMSGKTRITRADMA
jgi:hypothetical protein